MIGVDVGYDRPMLAVDSQALGGASTKVDEQARALSRTLEQVLTEARARDAMHRFALAEDEALGVLAVGAAVHPDAGDGEGPALPVDASAGDPTPPDAVLERLGAAFLRADVVVRRPGDDDGCWCIAAGPPPLRAEPLTADAARTRLADAVASVRAEAVTLRG